MATGATTGPVVAVQPKCRHGLRRGLDLVVAGVGIVALSPLLLCVMALVKLEDGGPVFYAHTRVGQGGRPFGLLKFRTMVLNADRLGGALTTAADPRLTRIGRWLRRCKLDELPQLINIVRGDMRFVGPRPEVERYVCRFPEQYGMLLQFPPGITDPASLAFRHEEQMILGDDPEKQYLEELLPRKLVLSLEYHRCRTWRSDLGVVLKTLAALGR